MFVVDVSKYRDKCDKWQYDMVKFKGDTVNKYNPNGLLLGKLSECGVADLYGLIDKIDFDIYYGHDSNGDLDLDGLYIEIKTKEFKDNYMCKDYKWLVFTKFILERYIYKIDYFIFTITDLTNNLVYICGGLNMNNFITLFKKYGHDKEEFFTILPRWIKNLSIFNFTDKQIDFSLLKSLSISNYSKKVLLEELDFLKIYYKKYKFKQDLRRINCLEYWLNKDNNNE